MRNFKWISIAALLVSGSAAYAQNFVTEAQLAGADIAGVLRVVDSDPNGNACTLASPPVARAYHSGATWQIYTCQSSTWQAVAGGATLTFMTVSVGGQDDVVADTSTDTLTLVAGTNITITTVAGTDTITVNSSGSQLSEEQVEDFVGTMVTGNTETGITVTYVDGGVGAGTLDFVVDVSTTEITDGTVAQADINDTVPLDTTSIDWPVDAVYFGLTTGGGSGGIIFEGDTGGVGSDNETILIAVDPTGDNTISLPDETGTICTDGSLCTGYAAVGAPLTEEEVEDFVGTMVTGNTETGIDVTYSDGGVGAGILNFVVDDTTKLPLAGGTMSGDVIFEDDKGLKTTTTVTDNFKLSAYHTGIMSYVVFATLTAAAPPTFDLGSGTTLSGAAIQTGADDDTPEADEFGALALTGPVTSSGLATAIATDAITDDMVVNSLTVNNATTAANLGLDGVDNLNEIAQGIKTAANDTDPLAVFTGGNPAGNKCIEINSSGQLLVASDTCAALGPGGTTVINDLGNSTGVGVVAVADDVQTWTWDSPATSTATGKMSFNIIHDSGTDAVSEQLVVIERDASAGTAAFDALLQINNNDTDGAVTKGIEVTSAAGLVTTAFDGSHVNIVNALSMGENAILVSGVTVDAAELEELATIGTTVISADDWTAVSLLVGTNTGDSDTLGPDGDKGDITVGATGTTLFIDGGVVGSTELTDNDERQRDVNHSSTLATPAEGEAWPLGTAYWATGGIIFEGVAEDTTEGLLKWDQAIADGDVTLTIASQTANANICTDDALCTGYQAQDAELDTIAALTETNDAVMFVVSNVWTADTTPAIVGTDFTGVATGFTAGNATLAATVTIADNENEAETNALIFTPGGGLVGGNFALESDGDATYNPSTGTIGAIEFVGGGAGLTGVTAAHVDTITWTGTSILETGVAMQFGDASDATLTHTYGINAGADVVLVFTDDALDISAAVSATSFTADPSATPTFSMTDSSFNDTDIDMSITIVDDTNSDTIVSFNTEVGTAMLSYIELDGVAEQIEIGEPGANAVIVSRAGVMTLIGTASITIQDYDFIPIEWCHDGTNAPAASAELASTNKVQIRDFAGVTQEDDVTCPWHPPADWDAGVIEFKVISWVSSATAFTTKVAAFELEGCSIGDNDALGCTPGAVVTSSAASASYAQNDKVVTAYSGPVTITDALVGEDVILQLRRMQADTDTYDGVLGVSGFEVRFRRNMVTQ